MEWDEWHQQWIHKGSPETLVEFIQEQEGKQLSPVRLQSFILWALMRDTHLGEHERTQEAE